MQNIAIVGLGNFGSKYDNTRHNVGFMFLDIIKSYYSFFDYKLNFKALISSNHFQNTAIHLLKPQTYMNLSGESVVAFCNFYKVLPDNIIVIQDDLDMEVGKIKYKTNSGDGGHNGIKDIQNKIGKNIHRIKIGIGRPTVMDSAAYVLAKFAKEEQKIMEDLALRCATQLPYLLKKDFVNFINEVNANK